VDSLSYATDVLTQTEQLIIPAAADMQSHDVGIADIDFNIKLTLGTAQFGPNGEIPTGALFGEPRLRAREAAWKKIRSRGAETLLGSDNLTKGAKSAYTRAFIEGSVLTNEYVAAVAGVVVGNAAKTLLRASSGVFAPLTGGPLPGLRLGSKNMHGLTVSRMK